VVRALIEYRAETTDAGISLRLLRRAAARERRVEANMWLAVVLSETGRPELAQSFAEIALELDPLTPIVSVAAAIPLLHLGRADEACIRLIRASGREPLKAVLFFAAVCAATAGRFDDARQQFDRVYDRRGGVWDSLAQAYLRSLSGDSEGTMAAASDPALVAYARRDGQACWYLAQALAHAGHHASALSWLERGAGRTFVDARFVAQFDSMLARLRPHTEFSALLRFMEKRAADALKNGFG
jgi:tetratricopeptide (TPR) repeat protein